MFNLVYTVMPIVILRYKNDCPLHNSVDFKIIYMFFLKKIKLFNINIRYGNFIK